MYGTPTALLCGKMLRKKPVKHNWEIMRPVPVKIASRYMDVQMFMDILCQRKHVFTHKIGQNRVHIDIGVKNKEDE